MYIPISCKKICNTDCISVEFTTRVQLRCNLVSIKLRIKNLAMKATCIARFIPHSKQQLSFERTLYYNEWQHVMEKSLLTLYQRYLPARWSQCPSDRSWSTTDMFAQTRQTTVRAACTTSCTRTGRLSRSVTYTHQPTGIVRSLVLLRKSRRLHEDHHPYHLCFIHSQNTISVPINLTSSPHWVNMCLANVLFEIRLLMQ